MTIICFIHWPWLLFKYILLPIVQLLFESSVWSAFDGIGTTLWGLGEGDHKLMSQWYYLVCTIDAHLNIYTMSQSMHSSEQNMFAWHLQCFLFHFSTLCSCVAWSCRGISLTLEYKSVQQNVLAFACVTYVNFIVIIIMIMLLVLRLRTRSIIIMTIDGHIMVTYLIKVPLFHRSCLLFI